VIKESNLIVSTLILCVQLSLQDFRSSHGATSETVTSVRHSKAVM